MSWPVLTWRDRAMLHNALRDVEEIAYRVMEDIEAKKRNLRIKVETTNNGEARLLLDCEVPWYLNISEALLLIRRLIQLVLEMDEKEKIRELEKWWNSKEKKEEVKE